MDHAEQRHFNVTFRGRQKIISYRCRCTHCGKTAFSSSYVSARFLCLGRFPLIPLGRVYISNECESCGHRGVNRLRNYERLHSRDLADMMDAFSTDRDNPETVLHGLRTLMLYNEERWFMDVVHEYGRRFYDHMQVQLAVAEGLFRFGYSHEAQTYCRKAVVLGGGQAAEELLSLCQLQQDKNDTPPVSPESMLRPYAFITVLSAILLLTLAVTGVSAVINYEAWLVSGSPKAYSVEINGRRYTLQPYERRKIMIRTGEHGMRVVGMNGFEQPPPFVYRNSWLNQKFRQKALVLNPDAMALLIEESMAGVPATNRWLFGEPVYVLNGIDHFFPNAAVEGGSGHPARIRLINHVPSSPLQMAGFLRKQGHHSESAEYARRVLRVDPALSDASGLLEAAVSDLDVDQAVGFLRYGLAMEPPLLGWHRFYQDMMAARRPEHDLQEEYGLLFKESPEIPEYLYLLGRVIRNRNTAKLYLEKFEQSASGNGLGYLTIAKDLLCAGRFKESESYVIRALQKAPDDSAFISTANQVHIALRQYDYPLKHIEQQLEMHPENGELVAEKIKYLTLMGAHQAALDTINSNAGLGADWLSCFHAARFYVSGNVTDYLVNLKESGKGNAQLEQDLHSGSVEAAVRAVKTDEAHDYSMHLVLYCAASYHGDKELADAELARAVDEVGRSTLLQLDIKTMLSGDEPPEIQRVLDLLVMPREKSILCAALGFKYPERQAHFFSLSRKFNIMPVFPQLLLKKWTRQPVPGL